MPKFRDREYIYDVTCTRETAAALGCTFDDDSFDWIPKSQIDDDSDVQGEGDEGTLIVSRWIADQKGF